MAALHAWLKVLNAIGGLAAISERMIASRARVAPREPEPTAADDLESIARGPGDPLAHLGQIETRLAGVVVAALKEAFDRDRARLDLERHHLDAERERADRALRQERRRLAGERALSEVRLLAILNVAVWLASAVLITWHDGTDPATRILLGVGWGSLVAGVACALAAHARLQALFAAGDPDEDSVARSSLATAATWLLVVGLGLVAASVLTAM